MLSLRKEEEEDSDDDRSSSSSSSSSRNDNIENKCDVLIVHEETFAVETRERTLSDDTGGRRMDEILSVTSLLGSDDEDDRTDASIDSTNGEEELHAPIESPHMSVLSILTSGADRWSFEGMNTPGTYHDLKFVVDGNRLFGAFVEGTECNDCLYQNRQGTTFHGVWVSDKKLGKSAAAKYRYDGLTANGRPHGFGRCRSHLWVHTGEYRNGRRNGYGLFVTRDGNNTYRGEWKNGKMHGNGTSEWSDGVWYEGGYRDGFRDGRGRYHGQNGLVYDGYFRRDTLHGPGRLTAANGTILLIDAVWKANKPIVHRTRRRRR